MIENKLKNCDFKISEPIETPFQNKNGIWQDGTTATYRDVDGTLWAISGHSHAGGIAMLKGTNMHDLKIAYFIKQTFNVGAAKDAFNGIKYPEGIESRGSVWPFGLYICPKTHRFFAFFHNETGWAGKGTAYDSLGLCETPFLDSDFRHIGLMHSDDEGKTWSFDRWVMTAEAVCFTEKYNPNNDCAIGQKFPDINLGSGDFSIYVEEEGDFIYIFYDVLHVNLDKQLLDRIDLHVARTRKRDDGMMGDFVKYYNGSFCEAGNMGKETPIVFNAWHGKVIKLKDFNCYMLSYTKKKDTAHYIPNHGESVIERQIQIRTSNDLINWSEPIDIMKDNNPFGHHYCAFYPNNNNECYDVSGNKLICQLNGNGTDVTAFDVELVKK